MYGTDLAAVLSEEVNEKGRHREEQHITYLKQRNVRHITDNHCIHTITMR